MPRRYSEEEAQRIFALVAERQRAASGADGLSLSELEEAARSAGLDPALVAVAAAELDAAPHPEKTMLGSPIEVVRTRLLDGPVSEDAWASMVAAARHEFDQPGMAGQIGRLREWTAISGGTKNGITTRLTLEPTPDGTRVTLSRSIRDTVFGLTLASGIQLAMAVLFGTLALAGIDPELWAAFGILAGIAVLMGAGVQIGSRVWHRREGDRFDALLDRFDLVARDAGPALREPAARAPDARLDPSLLDVDLEPTRDAPSRPRTRS